MPGVAISYHTTDPAQWGTGLERDLIASEVDQNFYNINVRLAALDADRPQPNNIATITVSGTFMTVFLDDATMIGPLPLPVLQFHWRNEWAPNALYLPLDTFIVVGKGIYSVLVEHTSGLVFDEEALSIDDEPLYNKLFGSDAGASAAALDYDMGFSFQGPLKDSVDELLWELLAPRHLSIDQDAQHWAYLHDPATITDQVLPILYNDDQVGTITFAVGSNNGLIALDSDLDLLAGERLALGVPDDTDATAGALSVMFLAKRVVD